MLAVGMNAAMFRIPCLGPMGVAKSSQVGLRGTAKAEVQVLTMCTETVNHGFLLLDDCSLRLLTYKRTSTEMTSTCLLIHMYTINPTLYASVYDSPIALTQIYKISTLRLQVAVAVGDFH